MKTTKKANRPQPPSEPGPKQPITQRPIVQKASLRNIFPNAPKYETPISDKGGFQRARDQGDTFIRGNAMYIAGSHAGKDWYDDATKVPFYGDLRQSSRYIAAEKALSKNPQVTNVVGHSLGGSVALELQKGRSSLKSRTYGAPVWDPMGVDKQGGKVDRYRNFADPFSMFDGSAQNALDKNPFGDWGFTHSYANLATNRFSGNAPVSINPDGTYSLTA